MRDEYIRKFYNEVKETLDGTIKNIGTTQEILRKNGLNMTK